MTYSRYHMGADMSVISCCIVYTLIVIATGLAYQFSSVFLQLLSSESLPNQVRAAAKIFRGVERPMN